MGFTLVDAELRRILLRSVTKVAGLTAITAMSGVAVASVLTYAAQATRSDLAPVAAQPLDPDATTPTLIAVAITRILTAPLVTQAMWLAMWALDLLVVVAFLAIGWFTAFDHTCSTRGSEAFWRGGAIIRRAGAIVTIPTVALTTFSNAAGTHPDLWTPAACALIWVIGTVMHPPEPRPQRYPTCLPPVTAGALGAGILGMGGAATPAGSSADEGTIDRGVDVVGGDQ